MNIEYKNLYNSNAIEEITKTHSDEELEQRGGQLANFLGLEKTKKGLYITGYGSKTEIGLYLSVLNYLVDLHTKE